MIPVGIGTCIGSIYLTNVSKPLTSLSSLELEEIPEIEEEIIQPEVKPPENSPQPPPPPPPPPSGSSEAEPKEKKDESQQPKPDDSQATSSEQVDSSAAAVGGAIATGISTPEEIIARGVRSIVNMNMGEGKLRELTSLNGLNNTINQLIVAIKQVQNKGKSSASVPSGAPAASASSTSSQGSGSGNSGVAGP